MINTLPIIGWLVDLVIKASLAVPFWLIWTIFGLGEKYFYFLPPVYRAPGFWDCVGVFIVMPILYGIFIPKFKSITRTSKS